MTTPGRGIASYSKFWAALGAAVTATIDAASDGHFTPQEIRLVGALYVAAFLVYIVRNDNSKASDSGGTVRPDPARV